MPAMYMGPSSAFGGVFGGGRQNGGPIFQNNPTPAPNGPMPGPAQNGTPPKQNGGPIFENGGGQPSGTPPPNPTPAPPAAPGPNTLGPQAIRASGPSQGYDPSYLQNLATAIGGLFTGGNQTGNTTSFNPLGNLSEISPTSGMEGNAPQQGLPQNWLQQALNGLGFSFGSPQTTSIIPTAPTVGYGGVNGGVNRGRSPVLQ